MLLNNTPGVPPLTTTTLPSNSFGIGLFRLH